METFGGRVQALRTAKGMGLRAFAREVGIAPSFLVGIEDGSRMPSLEVLERIAGALNVPVAELAALDRRLPPPEAEALQIALSGDPDELGEFMEGLDDWRRDRLVRAARMLVKAGGLS